MKTSPIVGPAGRAVLAIVVVLAGHLAVQIVAATPAAADTEVRGLDRVVSPRTPYDSTVTKSATARCPVGKSVLGGGASMNGDYDNLVKLRQLQPFSDASGDGFAVTADRPNPGVNDRWDLQALAFCANRPPGHQIVSHTTSQSSATFQTTAAVCPSGKLVVGTGAKVLNSFTQVGIVLNRSSGPRDISRASAREDADGFGGSWSLVSYAICAYPISGAEVHGTVYPGPGRGMAYYCPTGKYVLSVGGGGGLVDVGPYFLAGHGSSIDTAYAVNMTGLPPGGMAIGAICAPATLA